MIADTIRQAFEAWSRKRTTKDMVNGGEVDAFLAGAKWAAREMSHKLATWPSDLHDPPTYRPAFFADVLRKHFGMGDKR